MMNSWVSFLTWTCMVLLAYQCQLSASKITKLIDSGILTTRKETRKILYAYLLLLYAPTVVLTVYYQVFCVRFTDGAELQSKQVVYVSVAAAFLFLLTIAFGRSLY